MRLPPCLFALALAAPLAAADFKPLFDGRTLDGWETREGHWKVEDGVIARGKGGAYLWTKESYGDFVLELEFKVSKGCNSGVFFRADPRDPVQNGFEIQVMDSAGKAKPGKHDAGALYDAQAPRVNAMKPHGEWNSLRLEAAGPRIKVTLNGQVVQEADLDQWTTAGQNPDGSKNKYKKAIKDFPRTGRIGFQDHGHDVWYRNIRLQTGG
jgi:hypothetical protein